MKVSVVPMFDDGGISGYTDVFPILKARNLVGSFAIISDAIGITSGGYDHMDATEMLEMKRWGCDFINHTKSHQQSVLPTDTQANCYTEINTCISVLQSNGLGNGISEYIFRAPYGEWGTNYYAAQAQAGIKMSIGTVQTGGNTAQSSGNAILSPTTHVPTCYIVRTTSTSFTTGVIDRLITKNVHGNGSFVILSYHHIVASPAAVEIERSTANFTTEMDYLQTKQNLGQIEVITASDLYLRLRL